MNNDDKPSPGANAPPRPIGELFAAHRARVYQWASAHGLTHEEALDVVQETFVRMIASRPLCTGEGSQLAWLRRTASNLAIDARRSPRTRVGRLPEGLGQAAPPELLDDAHRRRLRAAIANLTELQRVVLLAKVVDGLTFVQIAADHAIAPTTAKTHYARAMSSLRGVMDDGAREGVNV